jgi:hypothetical protein
VNFIKQLKDTLFSISSYKVYEPNIAQLLASFAINLLERTRDFNQVSQRLGDIQNKASDMENPKDAYIIALLKGDIRQANLLLILADSAKGASTTTMQEIMKNQQLANKMFGDKSAELLNAQYLDNLQAQDNAAKIERSLAAYQALIPVGAQKAKWSKDLNNFAESVWKSPVVKNIIDTPIVKMLGAASGGFEHFSDFYKMPLKAIFNGVTNV